MTTRCQHCSAPTDLYLCSRCGRQLQHMLTTTPWYLYQLALAATGRTNLTPQPRPARILDHEDQEESPIPHNPAASAHLHRAVRILAVETNRIAHHNPFLPHNFIGPLHHTQTRLAHAQPSGADHARWLAYHYTKIVDHDHAGTFYRAVDQTIIGGTIRLINPPIPPVYRGPCPHVVGTTRRGKPVTCSQPLYSGRGDDFVVCVRCRTKHDVARIEQSLLSDMEAYVFTTASLFRVLKELGEPLPKSTFYAWKAAGRLREVGWLHPDGTRSARWRNDRDKPVYRLSDVRRLMATTKEAS